MRRLFLIPFVFATLAACASEPPSTPQPQRPQTTHVAAPGYVLWFPVVAAGEPVRGWAKAHSNLSDAEIRRLGIAWYYDYALRWPPPHRAGAEYIPFVWCDIYPSLAYGNPQIRYFDQLKRLPPDYSGYLLFLNEPDLRGSTVDGGQCERTPRQAAFMLKATREICPNCILVGPVVSHKDYEDQWKWLRSFYIEATRLNLRLPEISAIHTYLNENPQYIIDSHFHLLNQFEGSATTAWVTEFANTNPVQLERMIKTYKEDYRITRYAYFTARGWREDMNLINSNGSLTPLGNVYSR